MGAGEAAEADGDGEDETLLAPEGEVGHRQAALLRLRRTQPRQVRKGKKNYRPQLPKLDYCLSLTIPIESLILSPGA